MIAIIAGTGSLPIQACKCLLAAKKDFFVITLFPENNLIHFKEIIPNPEQIIQKPFYKAKAILQLLKDRNTKQVLFIGKVDKRNLLNKFKLDWFAIKTLATLSTKSDFSIMNKIEEILAKENITLISQNEVLKNLFVEPGTLTGELTPELEKNIDFGLEIAKQMSAIDIGQTVIVKDKMILAVEAIEGTNACIKRGIELGKKEIIICKSANPKHNTKFDLPTIGPKTLQDIKPGEVQALAWQSTHTFVANKDALIARAKKLGITLISR